MPDLRQALRDFVATSNSGKYATEQELMSKFPELKGYDVQALKDFVATSNSGKYATEDELFSKFPEFNQGPKVKKKFALDSSSEVGSSERPKSTNLPKLKPEDLREQPNVVSREATFVKTPKIKISKNEIKNMEQKAQESEALAIEKKKYSSIFDKSKNKPSVEQSKYLKDRLAAVNTDLINKEEEYVVPELEYQFGDLGFKFEESGAGDNVKVTAPNGKTTEISLDNFLSSKSKTQSDLLQKFIKENTPAKGLFVVEKTLREQDKKFNSEKQVEDATKSITNDVNALSLKQKQFIAKKNQFEKELQKLGSNPTKEQLALFEDRKTALSNEMKSLLAEEERIKTRGKKLDAAVGKYNIAKAKQGTWLGGIVNSIFGGAGKTGAGEASLVTDIVTEIAPSGYGMNPKELKQISKEIASKIGVKGPSENQTIDQWKKTLTEDQLDAWEDEVDDYVKKGLKSKTLPSIRVGAKQILGDSETTQQWEDLKKQDFWGGAILGLAESLPAMGGGAGPAGWAQRTAQMYAQVADGLSQEMEKDPDFKDVSENEKLAITLPIGITGAVLEEFGLRNIKGSQGVINGIALKVLGKSGKGITAKTFRELVENEVESAIARGALTITAAGAAEFETGAAQELAETGFKEVYNEIKGKEMFDTPDSTLDLIVNVVESGAQEAVGGFVLGVPTAVSSAFTEKGFLKMDDVSFETFASMANDDKMQSAYIASLKDKITQGVMTTQEAKDHLNNYRSSVGLFRQLPDGLDTRQKKEAMNLLKEKRDLENYVEGKDPALVVKQKERISDINNSLTKLTETNAVQEQSTTEIPVQSETGISETVAEGVSQPKPEVVTEQVTQEEEVTEPVTAPQTIIEEQPDVVKVKKSDDFMNDAEHVVSLNGEEAGRMYYDRGSKAWRDPNFDKSKFKPESFERIYGDILGETKQEATDELIRRRKESMKQEAPVEEAVVEETVAEKPQEVQFSKDTILNKFLNKLNSLNPLQKNPIDNKSFIYGDKASLEFNRFDKGDKNEISLEGISSLDKGKGLGKEAMADINKSADELGVTLTLKAKPFGKDGLGKKELIDFYKKNGFEVDPEYLSDFDFGSEQEAIDYVLENESEALPMVRTPKISEPQVISEEVEKTPIIDDLLELDTKDQTNLQKVLDFLDKADDALNLDPNELNDVTRVMAVNTAKVIVKTLKALVNAGITLQEAIKQVSDINNITADKIIEALDIVSKINQNVSEGISEMEAPGYNQLSKEIDNMIENDATINDVLDSVKESDVYKNATDVQKELLVRDVRKRFGLREKSAPSVGKLFGTIKDVKNITMREKDLLVKQIKDRAKGARESVKAWKEQSKEFAKELDELVKSGKVTNKQVGAILKRFSKVNIFSEKSMNRFTDYMVKIFNDANYKEKLSDARKTLSSLKKLSKNQDKNADLRALASEFIKIDPSFVDNIDEYNDIASKLKKAVDGSKIEKSNVKFAETVNAEDVIDYVNKTLVEQESKIQEEKIKEIQDLLGVDASEFSAEEINALLESDKELSNDDEKIVRATIKRAFDIYSSVIKEMLSTGLDPFTEEEVNFDEKQKDLIKRFMKIDPSKMNDTKEALRTVDSLINFIQNKSTAGMLKSIAEYEGIEGGEQAVEEGLKAKKLRKYWSSKLGLFLGQKTTSLPVLFDKMFKGVTRALRVEELIGMSDLINNSSKAESESNSIIKNYVKEFYNKKANGESFNSAYNDIERGVFAHVFRNVIGDNKTMKKVFDKRKQEVLDTIELLSNKGNESEIEIANLLQKTYDKILDGSENIKDVRSRVDSNNVKAVEYWTKEWSKKYQPLSDLALNFYNKVLGKDLNYTPDRIRKLQDKMQDVDLEDIQSQFFANTDEVLYDKKSGSLMDKQENRSIPKNMYVDFSFDKKNSNAMNDALTDLYTAFDIAKVGSFLKSKEFRKVFPTAKEADLIDKRIKKFVRLTRKKTPFSNEDISNFLKAADKIAKIGVTASLASPAQPFKQTIPVMFSTAMSAGSVGLGSAINKDFNKWLDDLGFAISNRGVESQAQIDSLNNLIEKAADMPRDKALRFIEKANDKALKGLLVNFDVWIARASFKAYYEQYLKRQGEKSSGIDYSKHKVNKDAANYAQRMIDRQQNISNPALGGDLFTSESKSSKVFIKMLMPFSSFRMNQSARLGADLTTLEYWNTSTKEDKIIALRSIMGYALESAAYRSLQIGFSLALYSAAKAIMGADDEEEDKKTVDNMIKGAAQSSFIDTFSPLPLADPFMQDAMSYSLEEIESLMDVPEEEKTKLFSSQEQSALKILGTYGIPLQKAKDIYSLGRLAYTAKYTDKYGKEKEISQDQADQLKLLIGPLFAASVMGVGSPDMTSIVNKSIKMAKKQPNSIDKKLLKERSPEMYKRMYGNEKKSSNDERIKALKERENRFKRR